MGIGDLTDLRALLEWVTQLGGRTVATLPLLAGFLGGPRAPFEPAPYAPASRLAWNELYVDLEAVPELEGSPDARALLDSADDRRRLDRLARRELVDYRATMAARRRVLEAMARTLFAGSGARRREFERFAAANPRLSDYARFRAATERHGAPWPTWPAQERDGRLAKTGGDRDASRYHLYAQWLAEEQLASVAGAARSRGGALYFDLPLGVHPHGYDVWRERASFLQALSAGAPPDAFFKGGQSWGFPPLSPHGVRTEGYRYPIEVVRHLMRHADVVRLDHAMSLHRLYVVPEGMKATDGLYIRYRPEELYAILCFESQRAGTLLVGEDLGTVPTSIRQALERHGISRTYVMQFALTGKSRNAVHAPTSRQVASFGTHDLPTFVSFWRRLDIDQWLEWGWLDDAKAAAMRAERTQGLNALTGYLISKGLLSPAGAKDQREVHRACVRYLALSPALMTIVSLEDLWDESRPQNVPGTIDEHPNWRRRARYSFETFRRRPDVAGTLAEVDRLRKRGNVR
jgi:4-alpha-glucanotransferase